MTSPITKISGIGGSKLSAGVLEKAARGIGGTGREVSKSLGSSRTASNFVSTYLGFPGLILKNRSTVSTMVKDMLEEICDGSQAQKITGIREASMKLSLRVGRCALLILFETMPRLATAILEHLLKGVLVRSKYRECAEESVYDLMNVEVSSRFAALDGCLYHNCLGISYLMTKYGLAIKLTNDTGRVWTEDEAQEQIDAFYDAYPELQEWQDDIKSSYSDGGAIRLDCGWVMWSDNENLRSVCNVPIQGKSASIMRKAVDLAESRGVKILFTLHDALYMEDKIGQEHKIKILADCMREAFIFYADKKYKKVAGEIKLDPFAWSPNYKKDSEIYLGKEKWEVPISNLYIDSRSESEYNKFSKYFIGTDFDNL